MKPRWMLRCAVGLMGWLLLLQAVGAPHGAGALAGLHHEDMRALAGLLWIVSFPLAVLVVPPLLAAEGLEAWWGWRSRVAKSKR